MADLSPSARSNGSGVSRNTSIGSSFYTINNSSEPANKIPEAIRNKRIDVSDAYSFPADIPPIHFGIIETEWDTALNQVSGAAVNNLNNAVSNINSPGGFTNPRNIAAVSTAAGNFASELANIYSKTSWNKSTLTGRKLYRLPLPNPIAEQFEVQYDINLQAPWDGLQSIGSGATGFIPNTFKTVTLSQPDYRRHKFTWTLPPRNYSESVRIQRILHNIKLGMHPKGFIEKFFLSFPNIYLPYFNPNPKYLFKFKPCVIENIEVNYQGGQPVPAFYRAEGADENRPPETVQFSITFLELEYWIQQDFKTGEDGIPSNEPFDTFNYYELASSGATGQPPGIGPATS